MSILTDELKWSSQIKRQASAINLVRYLTILLGRIGRVNLNWCVGRFGCYPAFKHITEIFNSPRGWDFEKVIPEA